MTLPSISPLLRTDATETEHPAAATVPPSRVGAPGNRTDRRTRYFDQHGTSLAFNFFRQMSSQDAAETADR